MTNFIFNEDGIKLGITDVVSYLSIQIEEENIKKVLLTNYYWNIFNKCLDVLIDEGFYAGKKYEESGTVDDTITIIEEFYKTHFNITPEQIEEYRNSILLALGDEIEGFDELYSKIKK